jgi:hypothetical protein
MKVTSSSFDPKKDFSFKKKTQIPQIFIYVFLYFEWSDFYDELK